MKNKQNIINWANSKNLIKSENSFKQLAKCIEELGETSGALLRGNREELIDGLGDTLITLIILAAQQNLDIEDCLEEAYQVIKNRTGKTVNGSFIKD